jgi:phosphoribosylaminoimidazole-succinocarboxamide synthase
MKNALVTIDMKDVSLFKSGKVRNVYDLGDKLLFVVSDRISAFDVIMTRGIPGKGMILNLISAFWFDRTSDIVKNHFITTDIDRIISEHDVLEQYREMLDGRCMLVKKAEPVPVECIVRGYISGSGWNDYRKTGKVSGIELPKGLKNSDKLAEPIFTPSTKAEEGHDMNITQEEMRIEVGDEVFEILKEKSLALYKRAEEYAATRGIIIADTKFEFGKVDGKIVLMDEALTPDSSRFWPKNDYEPGRQQKSFDKQFLRDYLETLDWDKTPPPPELPDEIVMKTMEKYLQAYAILTGQEIKVS